MAAFLKTSSIWRVPQDRGQPVGQLLRYKDACKRDLKLFNINPANLEFVTCNSSSSHTKVKTGVKQGEGST